MTAHLTLQSVTRVAATGMHLGFPSLCQYQDMAYIAYRQAQSHSIYPPGHVVIQRSSDLEHWDVAATLRTGGDDRDPKLIATEDDLICIWGTYVPLFDAWTQRLSLSGSDICTYGAFSADGTAWSPPYRLCRPGSWLWTCVQAAAVPAPPPSTLTRAMGRRDPEPPPAPWYGVSYDVGDGVVDRCHTLTLWRGTGPLLWERWATIVDARDILSDLQPSEPALFWKAPDVLACLIRTEKHAYYGEAPAPHTIWMWRALDAAIHAPAVVQVPGLGWVVGGREYVAGKKKTDPPQVCGTALWELECDRDAPTVTRLLRLPSKGDCSYPGMAWDETREELLVLFYSQHERQTTRRSLPHAADIYLARLTIEKT